MKGVVKVITLYFSLFITFFKCGLFAFGGGSASVPLIETEVVATLQLLTYKEFADAYAIGNTLPGPITTKLAALVGYRSGRFLGLIAAVCGYVLPSALGIILLFSIYQKNKNTKWVNGMMQGVRPIICILILKLLCTSSYSAFGLNSLEPRFLVLTSLIALIGFILLFIFKLNPIFLILLSLILGGVFLG
ncbi:chromate transporter [Anaeromicrobium sediminis]|uniref:Chromate transporter n=1 Tax=Anaeromicrobium sediminis TaxID=1478221 RepID=A0A267MLI3_9FIRM|nr:chromate transporter [Anaeromicrobium sediminis]PAB60396.1 hypothetical protein CCE28_05740 [Anaeromicrobium sediminis]